jgi:hypothetical protein
MKLPLLLLFDSKYRAYLYLIFPCYICIKDCDAIETIGYELKIIFLTAQDSCE